MRIVVYKNPDKIWYVYNEDENPEVEDRGSIGFTIFYDGVNEDGQPCECVCDYPSNYYYEVL